MQLGDWRRLLGKGNFATLKEEFGKTHWTLVSTGMAALELALAGLGIGKGDKVVLPTQSCFTVGASIIRLGATPVFIDTDRSLVLNDSLASLKLDWSEVKAVIAVHAYGLPCNIKVLRQICQSVPIIEDASLAFGLRQSDQQIGQFSDIVVSSLGLGKPLDTMEGGLLMSNSSVFGELIDRRKRESRMANLPPLPYAASSYLLKALADRLPKTSIELNERREAVKVIAEAVSSLGCFVYKPPPGSQPCWHRIPVWVSNKILQERLLQVQSDGLMVQKPHTLETPELPMFVNNSIRITSSEAMDKEILLLIKVQKVSLAKAWIDKLNKEGE